MEQIPNYIDAVPLGRCKKRPDTAEIVAAAVIYHGPSNSFARGIDAHFRQPFVIFVGVPVVVGRGHLINPLAQRVIPRGTFKTCKEEATKHKSSSLDSTRTARRPPRRLLRPGAGIPAPAVSAP